MGEGGGDRVGTSPSDSILRLGEKRIGDGKKSLSER